ncbi:MAG: peptidylprolyl isomerase [Rhodospirillaceae bacterium]
MQFDAVLTTVKGEAIHTDDVIVNLKLKGLFRTAIYELIEHRVLRLSLREFGLAPDEAEVARRARDTRIALGIDSPPSFTKYLDYHGVTAEHWLEAIRTEVIRDTLKQHLITPRRITESYRRDPLRFASVSLARIACRAREEADRVLEMAREGRKDFVELARNFSTDESTRLSGGYVGNVKRGMLPPDVEQQAFESADDNLIGPFRENALWTVYKVYTVNVPKLSDALKNVIRDQIFSEWLREQVCTVPA